MRATGPYSIGALAGKGMHDAGRHAGVCGRQGEGDCARRARVLPERRGGSRRRRSRDRQRARDPYAGSSKLPPRPRGCQSTSSPSSSGGRARSGRTRSALRARKGSPSSCRGRRASAGLSIRSIPLRRFPASARFLNELTLRFGNLGLAAAAYNAGPTALARWLAGKGSLPFETQEYVLASPATTPRSGGARSRPPALRPGTAPSSCLSLIAALRVTAPPPASFRAGSRPGACRSPPASRKALRCAPSPARSTITQA